MPGDSVSNRPGQVFRVKCLIHTLVFKVFVLRRQAVAYNSAESLALIASSCLGEVVIPLLIYMLTSLLGLAKSHLKHFITLTDLLRVEKLGLSCSWASSECSRDRVGVVEAARII